MTFIVISIDLNSHTIFFKDTKNVNVSDNNIFYIKSVFKCMISTKMEDIPTVIDICYMTNQQRTSYFQHFNISFAMLIATFQLLRIYNSVLKTVVILFYFHAQMAFGIASFTLKTYGRTQDKEIAQPL